MHITNPSAFASAQAAYDNMLPPSYYQDEAYDKERWLEDVSFSDFLEPDDLDDLLFSLFDGNTDIAYNKLHKLVEKEWEKQSRAH